MLMPLLYQHSAKHWNYTVDSKVQATFVSDRGLTFIKVFAAGHFVPSNNPSTALHVLEYVLKQK